MKKTLCIILCFIFSLTIASVSNCEGISPYSVWYAALPALTETDWEIDIGYAISMPWSAEFHKESNIWIVRFDRLDAHGSIFVMVEDRSTILQTADNEDSFVMPTSQGQAFTNSIDYAWYPDDFFDLNGSFVANWSQEELFTWSTKWRPVAEEWYQSNRPITSIDVFMFLPYAENTRGILKKEEAIEQACYIVRRHKAQEEYCLADDRSGSGHSDALSSVYAPQKTFAFQVIQDKATRLWLVILDGHYQLAIDANTGNLVDFNESWDLSDIGYLTNMITWLKKYAEYPITY